MTMDRIHLSLLERFAAPLPDDYRRRIIFWQDPEVEFSEMIDEIKLPDVEILKLTGRNNFAAKMLLAETDTERNYLVYNPIEYRDIRDNWLLDVELCSEEFRADLLSMRMADLGLPESVPNRRAMKIYARFFDNKERVAKLQALGGGYASVGQLHIDVMAVLAKARRNTAQGVLRAVLMAGIEMEENEAYQAIGRFGSEALFWEMVAKLTGFVGGDGEVRDSSFLPLMCHVMISALSVTMPESGLKGLEDLIAEARREQCYAFLNEWMFSGDDDALYELARSVEERLHLPDRFAKLEPDALLASDCFPCINECILRRYMDEISERIIKIDGVLSAVERRRTMKWYKRVQHYYEGILQVARMQQFYQNHISGFHIAAHEQMWKEYAVEYYRMDSYYRQFHAAFGKSLKQSTTVLEDQYKGVADAVEHLYKNWYLRQLGGAWTKLISGELPVSSALSGIDQQENFYQSHVRPAMEHGRVYVIISDALRYEVACELAEALTAETKGSAKISAMQSVIPSVTKFGMAALLPHRKLELTPDMRVQCDGLPTEGIAHREKVLKAAENSAIALSYKELLAMKRSERTERFRGAKVVYLYHNKIDAIGDKLQTEDHVFEACGDAIAEIKNLVRIITNEHSGSQVLITADHGFVYTYKPLEEKDKADKLHVDGDQIKELDRRYVLTEGIGAAEHMIEVSMRQYDGGDRDLRAYAPQEYIRIKKQGGGMNYVHGGISLQELCVPVISFRNVKSTSKKFVETTSATVSLVSQGRRISNSIFSLDFFQKEIVGGKVVPVTYEICLRNAAGRPVSDTKLIIADKSSANNPDRVTRLRFTLKNMEFQKTEPYYLTIGEKGKGEAIESTEFQIDVTFTNEFDF